MFNAIRMTDLVGVVLMGGRSSRMGTDKSLLKHNDQFLYQSAFEKLSTVCPKVLLSVNEDQQKNISVNYQTILDKYENQGPISGIISCLTTLKSSILILGCDLPLIDISDIDHLISIRDKSEICTVFYNPKLDVYDPMLSVWEYSVHKALGDYFLAGGRSLQKFLKQNQVVKHNIPNENNFKNINTLNDWQSL